AMLPLPEDYTEWTGEQFRHRIAGLIDIALADSVALRAIPLKNYTGVITQDHMTAVYYPTLYHFVARQAIDILQGFGAVPHIFAGWMAKESANSLLPFRAPVLSRDSIGERILAIYASVIDTAPRGSAPAVNGRLERLEFLQNHTADNMLRSSYSGRGALLKELYGSYLSARGKPTTEYAGDILLAIPVYDADRRELYDMMTAFLSACPGYWRKDCIRQTLRNMEQKTVSLSTPRVVAPGVETVIDVNLNNVTRMTVDIYDVSSAPVDKEDFTFTTGMAGVRKVASLPVDVKGERVPFDVKRKVNYTFSKPGNYIAVAAMSGVPVRRNGVSKIHVTRLALAATMWLDRTLWAMDAETGAPLSGVTVSVNPSPYRSGSVARRVGETDSIGSFKVSDKNGVAIAALGSDRYAMPLYLYNYNYDRPDKWVMRAQGYPSLPLYHPGDSVEWVAICYEYKGGLNRPYDNKDVTAVMYDANRMPVDTLRLVTDRFGRVSGGFRLPDDGLTGTFSVAVDDSRYSLSFTVSD
ncbi:MAG: hypothetical protein K2K77_05060, partial [Duncaniella sp.]|nr:hypothetical protein [Duncaniella sp.]